MGASRGDQVARVSLGLGLIGLPLLYCLLPLLARVVLAGTPVERSDIYMAGQLVPPAGPPTPVWQSLLQAGTWLALLTWPVLLATGAGYWLLVGSARLGQRRWARWQLRPAQALGHWGWHLLALLAFAYALGCVLHLLLPAKLWNPLLLFSRRESYSLPNFPPAGWLREEYWWPYVQPLATAGQGYTLYSPILAARLEFQLVKADCIKLGALLATLLAYRRLTRPTDLLPAASV